MNAKGLNAVDYVPAEHGKGAYNCPDCLAYSRQEWRYAIRAFTEEDGSGPSHIVESLSMAFCDRCDRFSIWLNDEMVFPDQPTAPPASPAMPDEILTDYDEARSVAESSPRAAAALLRLSIQKLCVHLGESGDNINDDIGSLVEKGLPARVQKALDVVRVVGNNAVHPGQIDVNDEPEIALSLFKLVNMIVDVMISQPQEVQDLFESLPEGAKKQIAERDGA